MKSRCRDRIVKANDHIDDDGDDDHHDDDVVIQLKQTDRQHFEASILSLRVQTNYSVMVQAIDDNPQNTNDDNDAILVSTKSCKRLFITHSVH